MGPREGLGEPVLVFPWGLACQGWAAGAAMGFVLIINGGRAFPAPPQVFPACSVLVWGGWKRA